MAALSQRLQHGVCHRALRARERHVQLGHDAPGAGAQHGDPVGQHQRLLHVVGHQDHRARLGLQRAGQPVAASTRG